MSDFKYVAAVLDRQLTSEVAFLVGLSRYARGKGNWFILEVDHLTSLPASMIKKGAFHGIVGFIREREVAQAIRQARIPAVNCSVSGTDYGFPSVLMDFTQTGRMVAQYFLERGFKNFAYLGGEATHDDLAKIKGYAERLGEEGLNYVVLSDPALLTEMRGPGRQQWAYLEALRQLPKPVAVMCRNDIIAGRLLLACAMAGIAVPEELAVVSISDGQVFFTQPALSRIEVTWNACGYQAATLLDRLMSGERVPPSITYLTAQPVIEQKSSDALAQDDPQLTKALHYIQQHACDPVEVEDVVKYMGITRRRLERMFHKHLRRPPLSEINRVRIRAAQKLLIESDLAVSEIAEKCGFANYTGMDAAFKRIAHTTPSTYRRAARKENT